MADRYDLVIVGMGSGGMVAAEFAATLDLEGRGRRAGPGRRRLPLDRLRPEQGAARRRARSPTTCGPRTTSASRRSSPKVDRKKVWERIRSVQNQIAATDDNPDRYRDMGIDIVHGPRHAHRAEHRRGQGRRAATRELETRYVLLCTGSRPAEPPIDGLADAGFVTSENLFELTDPPASFVNIGGGPIAVEMVQGFTRLGIPVTLLQKGPRILPRDEPALVELLIDKLRKEGVDLRFDVDVQKVTVEGGKKVVHGTEAGAAGALGGRRAARRGRARAQRRGSRPRGPRDRDHARRASSSTTAVARASTRSTRAATSPVATCSRTPPRTRACAPCATCSSPARARSSRACPWARSPTPSSPTPGSPSPRHATSSRATSTCGGWTSSTTTAPRADGASEGAIIVITHKKKIVGAHILAPAAGEMIHEFALAIEEGVGLSELSQFMHVYPTVSTSIGQLAGEAAFEKAEKLRWLVKRK